MRTIGILQFIGAMAVSAVLATQAGLAQEPYPSRMVKIVVPAPAGSTTDTLARILAEELTRKWGKTAFIENIGGGAMNLGAANVARSAADGYTLMIAPPAPLAINHLLYRNLGYIPTEFVPITLLAKIPNVLVVRTGLPAASVTELIAYAKANPGKLSYGSGGVGSTAQLTAAQLEVLAGIKMLHVPYRGTQPALSDVIAGHIDIFFDTPTTSTPLYREKKINILAVADLRRLRALSEVPTLSEAGLPGFRSITWFGLVAPPNTPPTVADKINRDVVAILSSKEVNDKLHDLSLDPGATTRADTAKFFAEETALWSKVIREAKIEVQ
jgi:tripartite-type tricarboxylate transporter receptor subunit TctC